MSAAERATPFDKPRLNRPTLNFPWSQKCVSAWPHPWPVGANACPPHLKRKAIAKNISNFLIIQ